MWSYIQTSTTSFLFSSGLNKSQIDDINVRDAFKQFVSSLTLKARSYRMASEAVDGMDVIAVEAAAATVGRENVEPNTSPIAGAEDFAFMLEKKPGAYIMIGNGGTIEGGCHNVHSPLYDFNDAILTTGAAYWVNLVQLELGRDLAKHVDGFAFEELKMGDVGHR